MIGLNYVAMRQASNTAKTAMRRSRFVREAVEKDVSSGFKITPKKGLGSFLFAWFDEVGGGKDEKNS